MNVSHIEPAAFACNANNGQCPWQTRCKDECRVKPEADFMSPVKRLMPTPADHTSDPEGSFASALPLKDFRISAIGAKPFSSDSAIGAKPFSSDSAIVDPDTGTVFGYTALDDAIRGISLPPPHDGKGYVLREAPSNHRQPPTLLPVDSQARKDIPLFDFLRGYFPRAFIELARFSKVANDKHNPGEPMHWSKGKSTDHLNCVGRHLLEVGDKDEFGFWHDVALFWRAGANLEIRLEAEAMGISYEEAIKRYEEMERAGP